MFSGNNTVTPTVTDNKAIVTLEPTSSGNVQEVQISLKEGLIYPVSSSGTLGIQSGLGEITLGENALDQLDKVSGDLNLQIQDSTSTSTNSLDVNSYNLVIRFASFNDKTDMDSVNAYACYNQ